MINVLGWHENVIRVGYEKGELNNCYPGVVLQL